MFSPLVSENDAHSTGSALIPTGAAATQDVVAAEVGAREADEWPAAELAADQPAGEQDSPNRVNRTEVSVPQRVPAEVRQLLVRIGVNLHTSEPGRKHVLDEFMRGRLVSLLAMGLTLRQAASALGLSHVAIWKELKRNAGLSEEVNAARFQAQIEPLLVIVRESKRSWRAATWLINYLSKSLQNSEETRDERGRFNKEEALAQVREREEFQAQSEIERFRAQRKVIAEKDRALGYVTTRGAMPARGARGSALRDG